MKAHKIRAYTDSRNATSIQALFVEKHEYIYIQSVKATYYQTMPALQIHSNSQARNLSSVFYGFPQRWTSLTLGYAF